MPSTRRAPIIEPLPSAGSGGAMVRRRGVGHPDALCDAVAEAVALALARHYREHFEFLPPHAVGPVLLLPGEATPRFGGGAVHAPMRLLLRGHAVYRWRSVEVPVRNVAVHAARCWLREHLHGIDAERHVQVHCELREIGAGPRVHAEPPRAGEVAWGDAHAPLQRLESLALRAEQAVNRVSTRASDPALGEDVEVLVAAGGGTLRVSAWCRFLDACLADTRALAAARERVAVLVADQMRGEPFPVQVNDGLQDDPAAAELTVTGTRAESGREGASGRSQGVNGVLAIDGPATHLDIAGSDLVRDPRRLCQIGAELIADALLTTDPSLEATRCRLLAMPGDRLLEDARVQVQLGLPGGEIPPELDALVRDRVGEQLARLSQLWQELCGGAVAIDGWPLDRAEPDPLLEGGQFGEARAGMLRSIEAHARESGAYTGRPVLDPRVMAAMRRVPRHRFVPPALRGDAYLDRPLPIAGGQTISQPFIVALMSDLAGIAPGARVLEVGTGSGYQTAVLAELAAEVCSIERVAELHEGARQLLQRLGYRNVSLALGDGRRGWRDGGLFDAVLVTAAAAALPPALTAALRPGGRLVAPLGSAGDQQLVVITRHEDGSTSRRTVLPVAFVPLL